MSRGAAPLRPAASSRFDHLDAAWQRHLDAGVPGGSLLLQTIAGAPERRRHLRVLPATPGAVVLDIGTGFGALLLEVAHLVPIAAIGIDPDLDVLERTADVAAGLRAAFAAGASARFIAASAEAVPLAPGSVDVVLLRLVLQHLVDPGAALAEVGRVLRPGGRVVAIDVDDGLSLTYPPAGDARARLEAAYAAWQTHQGGDRLIGRRIAPMLAEAGFRVDSVDVNTQSAFVDAGAGALERAVDLARLRAAASSLIADGAFEADELARLLRAVERDPLSDTVRVEGQFVVGATRVGPDVA